MTRAFSAIAVITLMMLASGCTSIPEQKCAAPANEAAMLDELLILVNDAREAVGLDPVVFDEVLGDVAADYACQMIEEGFFSHDDPNRGLKPGERLAQANYLYRRMGENLARSQWTAEQVFDEWMASESHRDNILDPDWQEIGLAVRTGERGRLVWVQEFAHPLDFNTH